MTVLRFSIFLLSLILITGCGSKKVQVIPDKTVELSASAVLDKLIRHQVAVDWLYAKGKIKFEDANRSIGASTTIKIRRDSLIWMNVKKLGFEAFRVQMTPDSAWILDRLQNEYTAVSMSALAQRYQLPGGFQGVQAVLLGNPIFLTQENMRVAPDPLYYILHASHNGKSNSFKLRNTDFSPVQMTYTTGSNHDGLDMALSEYQPVSSDKANGKEVLFSYLRQLSLQSQRHGNAQVDLSFAQVEIDVPQTFSFRIPPNYTQKRSF